MEVRNGQYRASRIHEDGRDSEPGKEGWFGREGQPPGPSMIVTHLTPERGSEFLGDACRLGENRRVAPTELDGPPNAQGFPALGSLTPAEEKRRERSAPDSSSMVAARHTTVGPTSLLEMDGGQVVPLGRSVGVPQRGMRPAGVVGPSRQVAPVGVLDVKGNSAVSK